MDRGAWWAAVHGVTKGIEHDLVRKQQQPIPYSFQIFFLKKKFKAPDLKPPDCIPICLSSERSASSVFSFLYA